MREFFSFKRMLTPVLIQLICWVAIIVVLAAGVADLWNKHYAQGLLVLVVGPMAVRVVAEIAIVFFRINATLTEISRQLAERGSQQS